MAMSQASPASHRGHQVKHMEFVVDKVALVQDSSEYFDFSYQILFHQLIHIHHHTSSRAGTIGQLVTDVPSGISLPSIARN
jgi:hypothetical protein